MDSWWYDKSNVRFDGLSAGGYRDSHGQAWSLFGGEVSWAGDGYLFPDVNGKSGVLAFSQSLGVPLICHGRWVDTTSPLSGDSSPGDPTFYSQFGGYSPTDFSGITGISATFWNSLATYAKANNIQVYEQDWLARMILFSPGLLSTPDQGDAFLDNMASAFADRGLDIQYCLALPGCTLQASKYGNVTTARASGDRFGVTRYHDFLYASRLNSALGIWPFSDVFMSTEINNLLLSVLSAGPVGTGDAAGSQSAPNLLLAMRADGVLVKPDSPLVPADSTYLTEAAGTGVPLVARTSTNNGVTTTYAVVLPQSPTLPTTFTLSPADLGVTSAAYFYDYFAGTATEVPPDGTLQGQVPTTGPSAGVSYYIIAPVGPSGIAFLGDAGKIASNGRKRISAVVDQAGQLSANVRFAATDTAVTLHGYAPAQPTVTVQQGTASAVFYDPLSHHFSVSVSAAADAPLTTSSVDQDPARDVLVTFQAAAAAPPTLPLVTIAATIPKVKLGSGNMAQATLELSSPAPAKLIVRYTVSGTAANGVDYKLLSGRTKFKPGQTTKSILITPLGNLEGTARKTVKLSLDPEADYTVGATSRVKISILNGDN